MINKKKDVYIMGMPSIHNPSWTLLKNGKILIHIEEQKLSRIKNQFGFFNDGAINVFRGWDYCLEAFDLKSSDISFISFGFNPSAVKSKDNNSYLLEEPRHERVFQQQAVLLKYIREVKQCFAKVVYVTHHLAHAASTYFTSSFYNSIIITADGWGEDQTFGIFIGNNNKIELVSAEYMPHSLGEVYTELTKYLGWKEDEEGKTMALSAYGDSVALKQQLVKVIRTKNEIKFNTDAFNKFISTISPRTDDIFSKFNLDLTASVQLQLEECVLEIAKWTLNKFNIKNLCLSGGLFLNSKINYALLMQSGFSNIWFQPACGDSGISLGSALYLNHSIRNQSKRFRFSPYLGKDYDEFEILSAIKSNGLTAENLSTYALTKKLAELLSKGWIIGLFRGRSELGPRALGNRSIIADPRDAANVKKINFIIKNRELFRPFAPCVLKERCTDFFDLPVESPFMLYVSNVLPDQAKRIPAVLHIDNTSRVQTITKDQNAFLYSLIKQFYNITNIPVILNTSFNMSDEPIVETPDNAVKTFLKSKLDYLVVGNYIISK